MQLKRFVFESSSDSPFSSQEKGAGGMSSKTTCHKNHVYFNLTLSSYDNVGLFLSFRF
jgi:hypothetical protein